MRSFKTIAELRHALLACLEIYNDIRMIECHGFLDGLKRELRVVPNLDGTSFVNLGRSSSDLTKQEMSDLIELIAAFGAVMVWEGILPPLFIGSMTGGLMALILLGLKKKRLGETLPFGPFLSLGAYLVALFPDNALGRLFCHLP